MLNPIRQIGDRFSRGWQARTPGDLARSLGTASKPWLRDGLAEVLARVGATSPARFARGALTIVTFHRVLPREKLDLYPMSGLAVTPEQLEVVLTELTRHFDCGSVIEAFRRWRGGAVERPPLAISFDDGALDNYEHARPVLAKLGLSATFYIPVKNVEEQRAPWHDRVGFALLRSVAAVRKPRGADFDRLLEPFGASVRAFGALLPEDAMQLAARGVVLAKRLSADQRDASLAELEAALGGDAVPEFARMMTWEQIRALHRAGHEIGSHSRTHPLLPELSDERVREEIELSRRELSSALGAEVLSFCYPNGSYDARALKAVEAAGYECAVTTNWGLNRKQPPFELSRCDMDFVRLQSKDGDFSRERLLLRLSGLQPGLPRTRPTVF
jgi:peptidoglycan/xylan/chitin deacetylase (PgdA/CDA1 family)